MPRASGTFDLSLYRAPFLKSLPPFLRIFIIPANPFECDFLDVCLILSVRFLDVVGEARGAAHASGRVLSSHRFGYRGTYPNSNVIMMIRGR